ncbi:MAG: putative toxin-antitoxin system toxin component, PIN family [Acidobacteria bacterium]|nr:putative toxin-antitoxin system toxin component, PIN family [Acidobacteriota bacterium]
MRVVLDTNILVSALISPKRAPAFIHDCWEERRFTLLNCGEQTAELRDTFRKPKVAALTRPHRVGRQMNQLKRLAQHLGPLPAVTRSVDPDDDLLLAMCEAGSADYLVTGDKSGLLSLRRHKRTRIVSAAAFARILGRD